MSENITVSVDMYCGLLVAVHDFLEFARDEKKAAVRSWEEKHWTKLSSKLQELYDASSKEYSQQTKGN